MVAAVYRTPMSPLAFLNLGIRVIRHEPNQRCHASEIKTFRAFFGVSPSTCSILWSKVWQLNVAPGGARPCHLLWALMFLTVYSSEEVLSNIVGVHKQTFEEWTSTMIKTIARLKPHYVS